MCDAPHPCPSDLRDIDARIDAAGALVPALEAAEIDGGLRLLPGKRAVLAGHWQGPGGEATRICPHMQGRRYRCQ